MYLFSFSEYPPSTKNDSIYIIVTSICVKGTKRRNISIIMYLNAHSNVLHDIVLPSSNTAAMNSRYTRLQYVGNDFKECIYIK